MQNAAHYASRRYHMPLKFVRWYSSNRFCVQLAVDEAMEMVVGARLIPSWGTSVVREVTGP